MLNRNLSGDVIEHIGTEIFDMESLEDLKKYLLNLQLTKQLAFIFYP